MTTITITVLLHGEALQVVNKGNGSGLKSPSPLWKVSVTSGREEYCV